MRRQTNHDEDQSLLNPTSAEYNDNLNSKGHDNESARRNQFQSPGGSYHVHSAVPHVQPTPSYHQPHGYAHSYHPPPQYNTPPPPPPQQFHPGGGIHYSYLLIMALAFATVVQVTKGGLFTYNAQRPEIVYTPANTNLRLPNGMNNYYNMGNNGFMPGMNNNPNMMMMNNGNNMMANSPNTMQGMNNMQQTQQQQAPTTSVVTDPQVAVSEETNVPVQEEPEKAVEVTVASTETDNETKETAVKAEDSGSSGEKTLYDLANLSNFKDNWDEWEPSDTPVFFHIPKAGGSTIKDIIGTCHRFIMATEAGITDGHADDTEIAVVYPGGGPAGQDRSPFVNVDTTTVDGILRGKEMGFADSGLADAVVTPFIYEANELFTPTAKGRLFTVFRHPIDRAISLFYYLQVADWEPTYDPELKNWSIKQYAESPKIENNWLTRQLSNQLAGDLKDEHLDLAMEVVKRKFLVGLMTDIETTMGRCERFFHWTYHVNPTNQEKCRSALLGGGSNSNKANKKDKPEPGSEDYELLAWQNQYDLKLYEYIESLFKEQEQFVAEIPEDFRNIDATCCKCDPATFPLEGFECPKAILF